MANFDSAVVPGVTLKHKLLSGSLIITVVSVSAVRTGASVGVCLQDKAATAVTITTMKNTLRIIIYQEKEAR